MTKGSSAREGVVVEGPDDADGRGHAAGVEG